MDDLAQWLTAQLDEDTRTASSWHTLDCDIHAHLEGDAESVQATMAMFHQAPGLVCDCGGPARILREIDAKRRIIEGHKRYAAERRRMMGGWDPQSDDSPILTALASVYTHRPGYREDWRP